MNEVSANLWITGIFLIGAVLYVLAVYVIDWIAKKLGQ